LISEIRIKDHTYSRRKRRRMPRVIITAEVEDTAKWEEGFRTHGDLFRRQTVSKVEFNVTDSNEVLCCFTVEDLDKYWPLLESEETTEAMAYDGIKRETVKISILDKAFTP
jgi:hypothetical protein